MKLKLTIAGVLFIAFLFALAARTSLDGLPLDNPGNIKAGDGFHHALDADWLAQGNPISSFAPYMALGYTDVVDGHPPLLYMMSAIVTQFTGIPTWATIYFIVCLLNALVVFLLYFIASEVFKSEYIGLASAVLYALPVTAVTWLYGVYIGLWIMIAGFSFFLLCALCIIEYLKEKKNIWLMLFGIFATALLLVHPQELILLIVPAIILFIALIKEKNSFGGLLKKIAYLATLPIVMLAIYFPRFQAFFITPGESTFSLRGWDSSVFSKLYADTANFGNFPVIVTILFVIGILLMVLNWKNYKNHVMLAGYYLFHVFILPVFINSSDFVSYTMRQKFMLPLLVLPIAAFGAYGILSFAESAVKNRNFAKVGTVIAAIILVLTYIPSLDQLKQGLQAEHITKEKYNALKFLQDNTPANSKVMFLDGFYQWSGLYSKRVSFEVFASEQDKPDLVKALAEFTNASKLQTVYDGMWIGWMHNIPYQKGLFEYGQRTQPDINQSIFSFDYIVMVNFNQAVASFNAAMAEALINTKKYELDYSSNGIIIVGKAKQNG